MDIWRMEKDFTENEFINIFGMDLYLTIVEYVYNFMRDSEDYKLTKTGNRMKCVLSKVINEGKKDLTVTAHADMIKHKDVNGQKMDDFVLTKLTLSTEVMPDSALDAYNELIKHAKDNNVGYSTYDLSKIKKGFNKS